MGYSMLKSLYSQTGHPMASCGTYDPSSSLPFVQSSFGRTRYCWPWPNGISRDALCLKSLGESRIVTPEVFEHFILDNPKHDRMSIYPGSIFSPVPYSIVGERTKDMTVAVSVPYPGVVILSQSMTERIVGMYPQYTYRLVGCRESNFVQIAPSLLSGLKVVGQLELVDGYYLDTTTKMKRRDLLFALKKLADEMRLACFASCATGFSFLADDVLDGILNMGGIKRKVVKRLSFDEVMAREYADI